MPATNQSLNSGKDKGQAFQASSLCFLTEMWHFSNPSCPVHCLRHSGCGAVCGQQAACTSLVVDVHERVDQQGPASCGPAGTLS